MSNSCLPAFALTAGWENVNPDRREFPLADVVWSAPETGFRVEKLEGAEGSVRFENGRIVVSKTNGYESFTFLIVALVLKGSV